MMHEITISSIHVSEPVRFGMAKSVHGEYQGARFWKRTTSRTWVCADGMVVFQLGRYLHSICGWLMNERRVFPLGWYFHVAAETELRWM